MKCWNSTFNAQSSKLIIVVVQVKIMKIYVVAMELFMKKERQDENLFDVFSLLKTPCLTCEFAFLEIMLVQGEASGGGMWLKCGNGGTT